MFMCATKFEVEEAQLAYLQEFLTQQEREAVEEEKHAQQTQDNIDPISDNEEEEEDSLLVNTELVIPSERVLGKQHRSCISKPEQQVDLELDDDDDDGINGKHPLPVMPQQEGIELGKEPQEVSACG